MKFPLKVTPIRPQVMRAAIIGFAVTSILAACDRSEVPDSPLKALPVAAGAGSAEPNLAITADGRPVLSWLEPQEAGSALQYAVLDNAGWTVPTRVAVGGDWFVNWADFPSVVPIDESLWAAHWLKKRPGNSYSYDVVLTLSTDGGRHWREPLTPHLDDTATEHGFVSLFPWQNGVGALWLDGRNTVSHTIADTTAAAGGAEPDAVAGMTLRSAVVTAAGEITHPQIADGLVCDCCQTDVALSGGGPVAVYRNRSEDEVRDIYVAKSRDGRWMEGVPVADDGWVIAGCPVNGPAIAARGNDVAVTWFTSANDDSRVRVALSDDGAESFGRPIDVDADRPIGRVGIAALDGGVLVTWMADAGDGVGDIMGVRISAAGEKGKPVTIASTASGRLSGFPQIVVAGDSAVFAWTAIANGESRVHTAIAPISAF